MKKYTIVISSFALLIVTAVIACNSKKTPSANNEGMVAEISQDSLIRHGEYLVNIMGCHDCHSPKKMGPMGPEIDSTRLLSGHPADLPPADIDRKLLESKGIIATNMLTAWIGPWGISYTANLTSDESGIGNWQESNFLYAIREGKLKGLAASRPLLPPMPWDMYKNMTDDELKAIFAYLKSTKPIKNVVPEPTPPALAAVK